jgi:hypothetical protein
MLETGNSVGADTQNDLQIFFTKKLTKICLNLGIPPPWLEEPEISQLINHAVGLFIWATTAIAFIEDDKLPYTLQQRLELILEGRLGEKTENNIDTLSAAS